MTIPLFKKKQEKKEKIVLVTCYDYSSALILKETNIDGVLIGDSLSSIVYGYKNTISTTMDMMIRHVDAVKKGIGDKLIIADMPFLGMQFSHDRIINFVKELFSIGCNILKIEKLQGHEDIIKNLIDGGVPIIGHIGFTPQYVNFFGKLKVFGKSNEDYLEILNQSEIMQKIGVSALLLECVPSFVPEKLKETINIPLIGIGAGLNVDGQILVMHDLLGFNNFFNPKYLKRYVDTKKNWIDGINHFCEDIKLLKYPSENESY